MKTARKISLLALLSSALLISCGPKEAPEPETNPQSPEAPAPAEPDAPAEPEEPTNQKQVNLPDHPFFADFAYPEATPDDAMKLGIITTVWFMTSEEFAKVTQFYKEKTVGGTSHVEEKRAYFVPANVEGGRGTVTVTSQPDGSTRIMLSLDAS